jgi:ketosteroid isomerase-like protein
MTAESTTPDLEEFIRRAADALARRDYKAIVAFSAPDAVWDTTPAGGVAGAVQGVDAIRGLLEDWCGPYEDWTQELEELRDFGNGVGFVVLHQRARLPGSSGVVALRFANVFIWANGLVQRTTTYTDIDEARAAAERLAQERG